MPNHLCSPTHNVIRKNRRLYYLTHFLRPQGYFSDAAMQRRDPVLYHEYVGQYIPDTWRWAPFPADLGLVDRVYYGIDQKNAQQLVEHHRRSQLAVKEGMGVDSSGQASTSAEKSVAHNAEPDVSSNNPGLENENQLRLQHHCNLVSGKSDTENNRYNITQQVDTTELQLLYQDLVNLFEQRFLAGEDRAFDYFLVDSNPDYDDVQQLEQDQEDAYFDAEDSE
ncbi:hypothetical protein IWQ61_001478 [Dispira simplex]|nr:hypothetical protein IWQ61_001478 [Dispira simplex]